MFKKAYDYVHSLNPNLKIIECVETNDMYIFTRVSEDREPLMGGGIVAISKETGEKIPFSVPPLENLDVIEKGKKVGGLV